ncbi:type II secretion system F family protein [Thermoflexus sp.]|uniref:type II secretion system F family protein n=1 Tax=Thermoflexus sp. TaxID=1969742 RepID=UPI002ADE74C0|nr:type II secretion system F family protein [Thermoflexus sp.]
MMSTMLIVGIGFSLIGLLLAWILLDLEEEPEETPFGSAAPRHRIPPALEGNPEEAFLAFASQAWGLETGPGPLEERLQAVRTWLRERRTVLQGLERRLRDLERGITRGLRRRLAEADLPWHPLEWMGLTVGLAALGAWIGLQVYRLHGFALLGALAGGALPFLFLHHRRDVRRRRLELQLADALFLIAGVLRAGGSMVRAIEEIAVKLPSPIADEFRRVLIEVRLGFSITEALEHMRERVPSEDLSLAITAIQIHQQVGGNLSEFLERVASRIRERVHLQNEIRVMTASYRLSAQILAVLPLFLWLVLFPLNRRYMMRFFTSGLPGYAMLGLILLLVLLGLLVIRRMMRVSL